jgi:MFS-type transporter involved in bile tolerance (Atg22 family)
MTLLLIAGLVALGLSHGCIQAPVVSYVANTSTAGKLGKSGATSLYRLFERVGNIGGPVIISQLLLFSNGSLSAISLLGLILLCLGILFALRLPKSFPLFQRA